MSDNFRIFKFAFSAFLVWRFVLLFITFLGLSILPSFSPVDNEFFLPNPKMNYWERWANWDGGHFLSIASSGYSKIQTPFFPLYPLLINFLSTLKITPFWGAFLISQTSTIAALFFLYKLVLLDFKEKNAKRVIVALLIFPSSFYLGAVYSESLFLSLTLAAIYAMRKKYWFLAAVLSGLAAATRVVGVSVIVVLFLEYLINHTNAFKISELYNSFVKRILLVVLAVVFLSYISPTISQKIGFWFLVGLLLPFNQLFLWLFLTLLTSLIIYYFIKHIDKKQFLTLNFLVLFLSLIPLLVYLDFQYLKFGSPVSFLDQWSTNWNTRPTLPWASVVKGFDFLRFHNLFSVSITDYILIDFLAFFLLTTCLILSSLKLRISYSIYFLFCFAIPLASGLISGLMRYALVIFPLFILLSTIENEYLQKTAIFISILLLGFLSILFINSYWVT